MSHNSSISGGQTSDQASPRRPSRLRPFRHAAESWAGHARSIQRDKAIHESSSSKRADSSLTAGPRPATKRLSDDPLHGDVDTTVRASVRSCRRVAVDGANGVDEVLGVFAFDMVCDACPDAVTGNNWKANLGFGFRYGIRCFRWRRLGGRPFTDHGPDAFLGVVALGGAQGHERAERVEQVLVDGGARHVRPMPLRRSGVPGAGWVGGVVRAPSGEAPERGGGLVASATRSPV